MNPAETTLLRLFRRLDPDKRNSLLDYARYLADRSSVHEATVAEPLEIARPAEQESVVGAMRRLTKSYHMLDTRELLDRASGLMTQHLVQGRDAEEIIGELEQLFRLHYEKYRDKEG